MDPVVLILKSLILKSLVDIAITTYDRCQTVKGNDAFCTRVTFKIAKMQDLLEKLLKLEKETPEGLHDTMFEHGEFEAAAKVGGTVSV